MQDYTLEIDTLAYIRNLSLAQDIFASKSYISLNQSISFIIFIRDS